MTDSERYCMSVCANKDLLLANQKKEITRDQSYRDLLTIFSLLTVVIPNSKLCVNAKNINLNNFCVYYLIKLKFG